MKIELGSEREYTIVEKKVIKLTKLTIDRVVDIPSRKIAKAFIVELSEPIILWEGIEYDNAGQWTDSDIEARLLELFK